MNVFHRQEVLNLGSLKYMVFNSLIGEIAIVWDKNEIIKQVVLPDSKSRKHNYGDIQYHGVLHEVHPSKYILKIMSNIKEIIMGHDIKFELNQLDLNDLTQFQREVLLKQNEIPYGMVTTYKKLAQLIGRPKSARPVANTLASNPFPLIIPCHRTVKSDWTLGGYNGRKDGYFKRFILENEGIRFEDDVIKQQYRYPQEDMESMNKI